MNPTITEDFWGGKEAMFKRLFELGLLDRVCKRCKRGIVNITFEKGRNFPPTYCRECHAEVESCRNGSIFDVENILNIPAFLFVFVNVLLRAPMSAIQYCSGLQPETARKYVDVVRKTMTHTAQKLYSSWEGQLGGPGKVVEIDEAFLVKNKFHVGRLQAKQGVIVFGITERDGGKKTVNEELYQYLRAKQAWRESKERPSNHGSLRQPQTRRRQGGTGSQQGGDDGRIELDDETRLVVLEDDVEEDAEGDDSDVEDFEEPAPEQAAQGGVHFQFNTDMEKAEREVFGPDKKTKPHRTLFFVVPDRSADTLLPIFRKYVAPGSIIFSDAWPAYNRLGMEYDHYTVVHKRRFVHYHFPQGNLREVVKVTTNHIERMWVEMRRDLRGVLKSEVAQRIDEVPYRLFRLATGSNEENLFNAAADMAVYANDLKIEREAERHRREEQQLLQLRGPLCAFH